MAIVYEIGASISGEVIGFVCRKFTLSKKPIQLTSGHKGVVGRLEGATCVINRKFRHIPDKPKESQQQETD